MNGAGDGNRRSGYSRMTAPARDPNCRRTSCRYCAAVFATTVPAEVLVYTPPLNSSRPTPIISLTWLTRPRRNASAADMGSVVPLTIGPIPARAYVLDLARLLEEGVHRHRPQARGDVG